MVESQYQVFLCQVIMLFSERYKPSRMTVGITFYFWCLSLPFGEIFLDKGSGFVGNFLFGYGRLGFRIGRIVLDFHDFDQSALCVEVINIEGILINGVLLVITAQQGFQFRLYFA